MSISVLNTDAGLSGKTLVTSEGAATITALHTYDRDPSAPFAVSSGSAVVTNLDADMLDGQGGSYYQDASNLNAGTVAIARGGTGAATASANLVFAGPTSGGAAAPSFRALVVADIPVSSVNVIDRDVTATTVANTTTETTVYTFSVVGGTLSTNKAIRLTLIGDNLNSTGSDATTTFRVKFGGTTIASLAKVNGTGANRRSVKIDCFISAFNATNAQRAFTTMFVSTDGPAGTISASAIDSIASTRYDTLALDSTGALTLAVTVQHGTADANVSFISQVAYLEQLP